MDNGKLHLKQVEEAKKRLDILVKNGLMQEVKDSFEKDSTVYYSFCSILYWLKENNNCDKLVKIAKRFEKRYNALVYHAIFNKTEFGNCLSLLYVSEYTEEWERDKRDLIDGIPLVWVENLSDPYCSEFGSIKIKTNVGGLIRTA